MKCALALKLVVLAAAIALLAGPAQAADDEAGAHKTLQAAGLSRISGNVWILPLEQRLRERHASLFRLRSQLPNLEKDLVARIERNRALYSQLRAAEEALKKPESGPVREQLRTTIAGLKTQCVEPSKLGDVPEVRESVIALAAARNEVAVHVYAQREMIAGLETAYRPLKEKTAIQEALARAGKQQRLGPASVYENELKELREADTLLRGGAESWLASAAPLYREGSKLRVPAVLNACQPLTFTWKESSEPTYITASMAEAAGLVIPADAPTVSVTLAARRELKVRQITLGTLDFGRFQLHDVAAYVLPPEGEDLGAQIGPAAFGKLRAVAEPQWLRLKIQKSEE